MKDLLKEYWKPVLLLVVLSLFKFYRLNGGINLGEPDEFIHADVAQNFHIGLAPKFSGGYWFFELPLFPYLGYLVSLVFPGRYLGLRIVSVVFSILLTLGIFFYLKYKVSAKAGLFGALIFLLSPMAVYYSRLGLLDMSTTAASMLFLFSLDFALARRSLVFSAIAGIFLGIALLIKYSALIYLILLGGYWLVSTLKLLFNRGSFSGIKSKILNNGYLELDTITTIPLIISFVLTVPLGLFLRRLDPYQFKLQLFTSLGFVRDFWRIKGGELTIAHYGTDIVWWISIPVLVLVLISLSHFLKMWRHFHVLLLGLILTAFFVLPHTPFYPRYFFPIIPFLAVIAGAGLAQLTDRTARMEKLFLFTPVLIVVTLAFPAYNAWASGQHNLIEDTGAYIKNASQKSNPWIFTSYWPNYFGLSAGSTRATWLTESAWDASAYVKDLSASPLEILGKEGGFVVLENLYSNSPIFIQSPDRLNAWQFIKEKEKPIKFIGDSSPNFPHFKAATNWVEIYQLGK